MTKEQYPEQLELSQIDDFLLWTFTGKHDRSDFVCQEPMNFKPINLLDFLFQSPLLFILIQHILSLSLWSAY